MSISRMRLRGALGQAGTIAVTLLGLLLLTFVIGRMMPADPVRAIVGEEASPEIYQQVFQQLGLDRPLWEQFLRYLGDVLTGDFGTSIRTGKPVIEDILHVMPATIELATFAILIGAGLGIGQSRALRCLRRQGGGAGAAGRSRCAGRKPAGYG